MITLHGLTVVSFAFYLILRVFIYELKTERQDATALNDKQLFFLAFRAICSAFGLSFLLEGVSIADATSIIGKIADVLLLVSFLLASLYEAVMYYDETEGEGLGIKLTLSEKCASVSILAASLLYLAYSILL